MFSCESSSHIRTYRIQKTLQLNKEFLNDIRNSQSLSISWEKPESWIYSKGSSMRIASFDVPFSNGILTKFFFASSIALDIDSDTSFALPKP